jgi:hypothetical protein
MYTLTGPLDRMRAEESIHVEKLVYAANVNKEKKLVNVPKLHFEYLGEKPILSSEDQRLLQEGRRGFDEDAVYFILF